MADTLLIHFDPKNPDHATWSLVNAAGEMATMLSQGSLNDATPLAAKHQTVVLLDSTAIHVDSVELPIRNQQKLLRAAPFALEEKIADDIDELHFVAGKTAADGRTPVAAINRNTLDGILTTLRQYKIEPVAIIPDALCLTANSQQWSVLIHNDQANIQFDTYDAGEFDRNILALLLESELLKDGRKTPEKIILLTADGDDADTQDIDSIIPEGTELIRVSYNTHPLVVYCGEYKHALALNLLQGEYKPASKSDINWQRWRLAASLATIWLCLHLGIISVQQNEFQNSNKKLQVEIDNIYKKAFPES
ncbi:MAG: type II secretion system protein GspL, partial [Gammaproteobacteria bacterium]|nr:type II secretion system protein GspL [Gammaproteobacteria bacterium]